MPPAALISLTASLTPLSKFVPDVAPVPDSSTNPTIRTGACCCARDGSAAVIIQTATEKQKTLFMNSSIQRQVLHVSHEGARLFEFETRTAWQELLSISVAEIAQKVRLDMPRRKELLLAAVAFLAGAKKLLVQLCVVEAGHRSAVELQRARCKNEIGALQRRVAPRGDLDQRRVGHKQITHARIVRKQLRQLVIELQIVCDDYRYRGSHGLLQVARRQ